jgi:hypothetical protein
LILLNRIIKAMKKLSKLFALLQVVLIVCLPALLKAQPFDDDVMDNPVPFDGGVSLLLAAAIGYGLKYAHDKKKDDKSKNFF